MASILPFQCARKTVVPVTTRRQFYEFVECDLNPFGSSPSLNANIDEIVAMAKVQAERGRFLADIATDLGRAFAAGGLAALDLFYVPAAKTRAEVDLDCHTGRGTLLTQAEFERTHGRAITDQHKGTFYRRVPPADTSRPISPLARVFSSACTNLADLYDLFDKKESSSC
nr:hypothetical protein [Pandoravirus massiliensis]